jgi:hypothetical protein
MKDDLQLIRVTWKGLSLEHKRLSLRQLTDELVYYEQVDLVEERDALLVRLNECDLELRLWRGDEGVVLPGWVRRYRDRDHHDEGCTILCIFDGLKPVARLEADHGAHMVLWGAAGAGGTCTSWHQAALAASEAMDATKAKEKP